MSMMTLCDGGCWNMANLETCWHDLFDDGNCPCWWKSFCFICYISPNLAVASMIVGLHWRMHFGIKDKKEGKV